MRRVFRSIQGRNNSRWDLVQLFKHMEKVVFGTKNVNLDYYNYYPYVEWLPRANYLCPYCAVNFRSKDAGCIECPFCHRNSYQGRCTSETSIVERRDWAGRRKTQSEEQEKEGSAES